MQNESSICHEILTISNDCNSFVIFILRTRSISFMVFLNWKLMNTIRLYEHTSFCPQVALQLNSRKLRQLTWINYYSKGHKTYQTVLLHQKDAFSLFVQITLFWLNISINFNHNLLLFQSNIKSYLFKHVSAVRHWKTKSSWNRTCLIAMDQQ